MKTMTTTSLPPTVLLQEAMEEKAQATAPLEADNPSGGKNGSMNWSNTKCCMGHVVSHIGARTILV